MSSSRTKDGSYTSSRACVCVLYIHTDFSVNPISFRTSLFTVTLHCAVLSPASAVITVVPAEIAVTNPESLTFATSSLSDFQFTFCAPSGLTVAVNCSDSPYSSVNSFLSSVTLSTSMPASASIEKSGIKENSPLLIGALKFGAPGSSVVLS